MPVPTPLVAAPASLAPGRELLLKREDVHELGAFKWRAALPVVDEYRRRGADAIVTASTGNHGAATAWAGNRLGVRAVIFAPQGSSQAKLAVLEALGADVRLVGSGFDESKAAARGYAAENELPFFEDGAEPAQYEAYGAIGEEILAQLPSPPAAVVVPVGNGALMGGIGLALGRLAPRTVRVGAVPKEAPVMARSWRAGRLLGPEGGTSFADGLAVRVAIPYATRILSQAADRMVEVSERAIARAVASLDAEGIRVEGAAGAALAAVDGLGDLVGPIVLVLTGRNIDDELLARCRDEPESFPD